MEDWIYRNLDKYGNCFIDQNTYKRFGKNCILMDLMRHGFKCDIVKTTSLKQDIKENTYVENDYIINVLSDIKNKCKSTFIFLFLLTNIV